VKSFLIRAGLVAGGLSGAFALTYLLAIGINALSAESASSSWRDLFGSSGQAPYRVGDRLSPGGHEDGTSVYREVSWERLVPADWKPVKVLQGMNLGLLRDSDPRAREALERMRAAWKTAPVNASLQGERIRIPGFVVPLENQRSGISEFLLVPYFGACIHTPPPPANQIIHVRLATPLTGTRTMDAVWVSGVLEVGLSQTGIAAAGYRMKADVVARYRGGRRLR
jgi:uncharacterized protein